MQTFSKTLYFIDIYESIKFNKEFQILKLKVNRNLKIH